MDPCGQLQVLQDMGLPTGVEVKTESVKSEEAEAAVTVEEFKPVVTPIETTTAATGTANVDTTDAVEVQRCSVCQQGTIVEMKMAFSFPSWALECNGHLSFLSGCSPTGTNPHQTRQEPRDGAEREAPWPEV